MSAVEQATPAFWLQLLAIGTGGAAGAVSRYLLSAFIERRFAEFPPAGTLVVNVLGCLLIGILAGIVLSVPEFPIWVRATLITGFLGSLTTFSTFGYQTLVLLEKGQVVAALGNVLANVLIGLAAVSLGYFSVIRAFHSTRESHPISAEAEAASHPDEHLRE